jgi:ABC-type multidrug transport system fused ATPase/permease subunit
MGVEGLWVILFSALILLSFAFLALLFWLGWRISQRSQAVSPYTGIPLRRTTEISYYSAERILRYLYEMHQYDNRIFKLSRAAFCRETGRIFQDCVTLFDTIKIDWTFLKKRYSGDWISWGSLNQEQQDAIREVHASLDRFQTAESSPSPAPRAIEPEYVYTKPGPLYVDLDTKILLGWQVVPGTEFEILVVQKPIK